MNNLIYILPFFFIFIGGCQAQVCYVEGECILGRLADNTILDDYNQCLEFCQLDVPSCRNVTYYEEDKRCVAWETCPVISTADCDGCYTSERGCSSLNSVEYNCTIAGSCKGATITNELRTDEEDCIALCQDHEYCNYYTFDTQTKDCFAMITCSEFDSVTCPTCLSGQRECALLEPAKYYTALMVIGGDEYYSYPRNDVEVIDLSGQEMSCPKPSDYPIPYGSTGHYYI